MVSLCPGRVKTAACLSVEEEMNRIARNSYAENGKCVRFFGISLFCFRESIDVDNLISANAKRKTGAPQAQAEKLSSHQAVRQLFASGCQDIFGGSRGWSTYWTPH
jgi:hypothetical protein